MYEAARVGHVAVVQDEAAIRHVRVLIEMVDPFGVEQGSAPLDAVHHIALAEEKFGQIGAVLAGDSGDQRDLGVFHDVEHCSVRGIYPLVKDGRRAKGARRIQRLPPSFASSRTQSCSGSASIFLPSGKRDFPAWTTNKRSNRRSASAEASDLVMAGASPYFTSTPMRLPPRKRRRSSSVP